MRVLPPLDAHAHIALDIEPADISALGAYVFAMTRSCTEFDTVRRRNDNRLVWGLGAHPGLVGAIKKFDVNDFSANLKYAPLVGEVGLDGSSRVPMSEQVAVLRSILGILQDKPRLISMHSAGAQLQIVRELHRTPVEGVILHWWKGSLELTEEAVRLGCYFSLPPALMSSGDLIRMIPRERLLPETDHPYGDRRARGRRRPGGVSEVEERLGRSLNLSHSEMRMVFWRNLNRLVKELGVEQQFRSSWRAAFDGLP